MSKRRVALFIETSREYGRNLLRGIIRYEREHGDWSIYFKPGGLSEPAPDWLQHWQGDGIIARVTSSELAKTIHDSGVPAIDLWSGLSNTQMPSLGVDNPQLANMVSDYFINQGFRHFGFFGTAPAEHHNYDIRRTSFIEALQQRGYPTPYVYTPPTLRGRWDWEKSRARLVDWVKELPKPIAIMTCHDDSGIQLLEACHAAEISVPDEVAVMGVNNDEFLCNLSIPPLSSVDLNPERIGYAAAHTLDRMMQGENIPATCALHPPNKIIIRQSSDITSVSDPYVAKAASLIREHACNGTSVEEILFKIPISRTALYRRFKEHLGRSPKQELTRIRMQKAQELLTQTKLSISQIAERTGYEESKYFIEVFAREMKITPLRYRKQHQNRQ